MHLYLSTKTGKSGSGIVQIQGEYNPDESERAYSFGVELVKKLHDNGYTLGLVNKNVNAGNKISKKLKTGSFDVSKNLEDHRVKKGLKLGKIHKGMIVVSKNQNENPRKKVKYKIQKIRKLRTIKTV